MTSIELAWQIRRHAIEMVHHAHASHIGGILSVADIVAVLYSDIVHMNPDSSKDPNRDRVILSKGHNGVALYAALAEMGFFPISELEKYGDNGCQFSCHVSHKDVPGIELSTGSLGHGVCVACGMALHARRREKEYRVYAIVGDGECNEGSVWETAMLAAQEHLSQLTVVVDCNGMQAMGNCADVLNMKPMETKWDSFGWYVESVDGHDHNALRKAFSNSSGDKPKVILAYTTKGKGVSFMENELLWHYRDPQGEDYARAVAELEEQRP